MMGEFVLDGVIADAGAGGNRGCSPLLMQGEICPDYAA